MAKETNRYTLIHKNLKATGMNINEYFEHRLKSLLPNDIFNALQNEFGGSSFYFPRKDEPIHVDDALAKHIIDEFNGYNIIAISNRYNLPQQQVYQIVKSSHGAAALSKTQGNRQVSQANGLLAPESQPTPHEGTHQTHAASQLADLASLHGLSQEDLALLLAQLSNILRQPPEPLAGSQDA